MRKPTQQEAQAELRRRRVLHKKPWDPIDALLPHQRPWFLDESWDRIVEGTRQTGKSTFAAVELIDASMNNPGSESGYVDMDIEHADKVIWREIDRLLTEYDVPAKISDGQLRFENNSIGYVFSGKEHEIKKLQGLKFARLIVDEAQEASSVTKILTMCKPALMRHNGRVILMGIPGRIKQLGEWWEATNGQSSGLYGQHRGTFRDNTALPAEAKDRLFESERARLGVNNPEFLRHWLGVWPDLDNALRVYHYNPGRNGYGGVPPECELSTLGLDPGGVRDAEAIVVIGHGNGDGNVWHLDEDVSEKGEGGAWSHEEEESSEKALSVTTADRVGPLQLRWRCWKRYYDWGSAHKDALPLIWRKDSPAIILTGVPSKDPYEESKRINELFAQQKLWIRKGSKLERDLLYTTWDEKTLENGGKPKYSKAYKQNAADALRCAMWGAWTHVQTEKVVVSLSDIEREAKRVADGEAYKKKFPQRADKYRMPGDTQVKVSRFGRVNRGY